jgi:rhodanese-related sulfurtransferase
MTSIDYPELRRLLDDGAQLVEVLPAGEYAEMHLPGSVNIPLKALDAASTAGLDRDRPVVVYCWDALCDMSPRAACRLVALGFSEVYDYVAGKVDWLARNLPVEGTAADSPTIGRCLRFDVVTARPGEPLAEVRARVAGSPHSFALVTTDGGILLGRLRGATLADADPAQPVEAVMEAGPSTLRPHEQAAAVRARLEDRGLTYAIVTDPDGRLLGTVRPADLA